MTLDVGLNEETEEIIVGMAKLGAVFGTFLGGALMQQCGRKRAIAWNSVFFIAGPVVMAAADDAARGPVHYHLASHITITPPRVWSIITQSRRCPVKPL